MVDNRYQFERAWERGNCVKDSRWDTMADVAVDCQLVGIGGALGVDGDARLAGGRTRA